MLNEVSEKVHVYYSSPMLFRRIPNSQAGSARPRAVSEAFMGATTGTNRPISTEELAMVCGRTLQALRDVRHMLPAEGIDIVDAALNDAI